MSIRSRKFNSAKACSQMVAALAFVFLFHCELVAQQSVEKAAQRTDVVESQAGDSVVTLDSLLEKYRESGEEKWESHIQKLEQRNVDEGAWPEGSLLFFGSSSFRRWETMNADMVPYPAINRGYGGAKYVDMVLFAERMFKPHQYRSLMLFAANDVQGKGNDSSPEEVACAVREIIRVSKAHLPDAPIFIVEITPTESRFAVWEQTRAINATLREIALTSNNTSFITTAEHYLNADGAPKSEYFVDDKLHLNEQGYKKWAELLKARLDVFLPAVKD